MDEFEPRFYANHYESTLFIKRNVNHPNWIHEKFGFNLEDGWEDKDITAVNISDWPFTDIPLKIGSLNLKELIVNYTYLAQIPHVLHTSLKSLKVLDLAHNRITDASVPPACCHSLVKLNLSHNLIQDCPDWITTMCPQIQEVYLGNNCFKTRFQYHRRPSDKLPFKKIEMRSSNLDDSDFRFLSNVRGLEYLDLSNDKSSKTINEFRHMKTFFWNARWGKLQSLTLNNIPMFRIPESLFEIRTLVELNLSGCSIMYWSEEFVHMVNLKILDISRNFFMHLCTALTNLKNLSVVKASYNAIVSVDPFFNELEVLDLYHNKLTDYSFDLHRIKYIDLEENNVPTTRLGRCYNTYQKKRDEFRFQYGLQRNNGVIIPHEMHCVCGKCTLVKDDSERVHHEIKSRNIQLGKSAKPIDTKNSSDKSTGENSESRSKKPIETHQVRAFIKASSMIPLATFIIPPLNKEDSDDESYLTSYDETFSDEDTKDVDDSSHGENGNNEIEKQATVERKETINDENVDNVSGEVNENFKASVSFETTPVEELDDNCENRTKRPTKTRQIVAFIKASTMRPLAMYVEDSEEESDLTSYDESSDEDSDDNSSGENCKNKGEKQGKQAIVDNENCKESATNNEEIPVEELSENCENPTAEELIEVMDTLSNKLFRSMMKPPPKKEEREKESDLTSDDQTSSDKDTKDSDDNSSGENCKNDSEKQATEEPKQPVEDNEDCKESARNFEAILIEELRKNCENPTAEEFIDLMESLCKQLFPSKVKAPPKKEESDLTSDDERSSDEDTKDSDGDSCRIKNEEERKKIIIDENMDNFGGEDNENDKESVTSSEATPVKKLDENCENRCKETITDENVDNVGGEDNENYEESATSSKANSVEELSENWENRNEEQAIVERKQTITYEDLDNNSNSEDKESEEESATSTSIELILGCHQNSDDSDWWGYYDEPQHRQKHPDITSSDDEWSGSEEVIIREVPRKRTPDTDEDWIFLDVEDKSD